MCRQQLIALLVLTLVSCAALARPSHAQWLRQGAPVRIATGRQHAATIVSDDAGGAIDTWVDDRGTTGHDIYAQRVDAAGAPQWLTNGVPTPVAVCTYTGNQDYPTIASDNEGGAIVTWVDTRNGNIQIYAQKVDQNGATQWTADGVQLCNFASNEIEHVPAIVSDDGGGAIVTWNDDRNSGNNGSGYDIYAQRVNLYGELPWGTNGVAVCAAMGDQDAPKIASDNAHGAIITWYVNSNERAQARVVAQRVTAGGSFAYGWPEGGVVLYPGGGHDPVIVSDDAGGAIVTWADGNIRAQRVNAEGVRQWVVNGDTTGVPLCTTLGHTQAFPSVVSDDAQGAIVAWQDYRSATNWDIYAQRVLASGALDSASAWTANGSNFNGVALCTFTGDQQFPTIVSDSLGGAIVTWEDSRHVSTSGIDIYAQRVSSAGEPLWTYDGVALCDTTGDQLSAAHMQSPVDYPTGYPTIASDGAGGAIVTWQDNRGGSADSADICVQRAYVQPPTIDVYWADTFIDVLWTRQDVLDLGLTWKLYVDDNVVDTVAHGTRGSQHVEEEYGFTPCTYHQVYLSLMTPNGYGSESNTVSGMTCCENNMCEQARAPARAQRVAQHYPLALEAPRPNPARGASEIRWSIPPERAGERFQIAVFDVGGRKVATVAEGEAKAGSFSGTLRPQGAGSLTNGVYFFRLKIGSSRLTRSLIVAR